LSPYVGGSFGLVDLWNAQTLDSAGAQRALKASTFGYGAHVGLALELPSGALFAEAGYRSRVFPSLEYSGTAAVPRDWPRRLDLSGWEASVGWQFSLKPAPAKAKPAELAGLWTLQTVDGDTVPAIADQTDVNGRTRTEIREMVLRLLAKKNDSMGKVDSTYEVATYLRTVALDAEGRRVSIVPEERSETGRWEFKDNVVTLFPDREGQTATRTLWRNGGTLVSNLLLPKHRLVFVR
jgi:hypothetical protein